MTFDVVGVGTEHPGNCVVCHERIEASPQTHALLLRGPDGWAVVHIACCRNRVTVTTEPALFGPPKRTCSPKRITLYPHGPAPADHESLFPRSRT